MEGISRISWADIQKPDKSINGGEDGVTTGITQCGGRLVSILDFEKITADISPATSIQMAEIEKLGKREERSSNIVVVEDSVLLIKMIQQALIKAGYHNLELLTMDRKHGIICGLMVGRMERWTFIITDIEMPKMDGHRLTKLVKEDEELKHIPIVIFLPSLMKRCGGRGRRWG